MQQIHGKHKLHSVPCGSDICLELRRKRRQTSELEHERLITFVRDQQVHQIFLDATNAYLSALVRFNN